MTRKRKKTNPLSRLWHRAKSRVRHAWLRVRKPLLLAIAAVLAWFFWTLPAVDKLARQGGGPNVVVQTESGQVIGGFGQIYGNFIGYDQIPQSLVDAVLSTEDRNFYRHFGIDPIGLARAMVANARAKGVVQGGSTITQQVAKNVFLTPERTLLRKLREMFVAFKLELHFSKREILTIYLNRVYMGAGTYGVDAAARRYFNKPAQELSLSESAIIAGLLKAPSRFAPTSSPERSRGRAEVVLSSMVEAGYLKPEDAERAKKELAQTIQRTGKQTAESAQYFVDWVLEQLPRLVQNVEQDLVVTATLDPAMQRLGEQAINGVMDKEGEKKHASQAALVAMEPNGAIRVMIGGRDYSESPYNRAAQAHRQPGSSFKLFVYLAGLEAGLTPATVMTDAPITIGKWSPNNYDGQYRGDITIQQAVMMSVNTIAVQVAMRAGLENVVHMAERMGIQSDMMAVPSIALGTFEMTPLEMTGAYAHMAAGGAMTRPYGILKIETPKGKVLYEHQSPTDGNVLAPDVVGMMNLLLEGVVQSGTGRGAAIGRPAAGKTGTTSDYRDAWFMGYTPDLVTGVWVGNDDNKPMKKVTGGTLPAPIWREFMRAALAGVPAHDLPIAYGPTAPVDALPWQAPEASPSSDPFDFHLGASFWDTLLNE